MAVEKKINGEQRKWKANEERRRKIRENLGLGDCALIDLNNGYKIEPQHFHFGKILLICSKISFHEKSHKMV